MRTDHESVRVCRVLAAACAVLAGTIAARGQAAGSDPLVKENASAGDVVMKDSFLAASQVSSMKAWLAAFDAFQMMHARTIVPSHGPVGDGSLIQDNRAIIQDIQARVQELKTQGRSADDIATTVQKEFQAKFPQYGRANGVAAARAAYTE